MRLIRLVLSLSLVLAFTASASEKASTLVTLANDTMQELDDLGHQLTDTFTTSFALTESSFFSGIDAEPDCLISRALKRPVVKHHVPALADNVHLSPSSSAQWQLIRGPPLV